MVYPSSSLLAVLKLSQIIQSIHSVPKFSIRLFLSSSIGASLARDELELSFGLYDILVERERSVFSLTFSLRLGPS